ncbi:MAG: glycine--tRNA ligase subunit beta [Candidatus Aminicenantes bacterium]|nr:glycine--tRNA ligase subunit beta [Candidatus Aminicenantes bacterium]
MEFLLEILTEELPASHVKAALEQLDEKFRAEFKSAGIAVQTFEILGTCRRLVVRADTASGQEDSTSVVTGPPKSVGILSDGTFSPAARGFAKAQGIVVESLEIIQTPRGEYIGMRKTSKGKPAQEVLAVIVPAVIVSISFPKAMRWREGPFKFSRPIKNILCLCDGKVLPFNLEGLDSNDTTSGHPIYSPQPLKIKNFQDYKDQLKKAKVIVDPGERRKIVLGQIEEKLASLKARIYTDDDLLERLSDTVEYPCVILGAFPEKYLSLPIEVLATAMREGQKVFSVVKDKKQLPYFLGVADALKDSKSLIRKGNERVLKARLEDARFFWQQDVKKPLAERVAGLKNIVFQEKLGTYDDKAQRLKKIAGYLSERTDAAKVKKEAVEAAGLCKADLLTEMVKEFPSLQGKMGGLYAKAEGYPAAVHQAIYEHYQPASLEDEPPSSLTGALVSLADKIDSIVGVLGVGVQVTGSSDPFGLRRNAHGVAKIILDKKLSLSFSLLIDKVISIYGDRLSRPAKEVKATCLDFFAGRLRFIFERQGFRYDHINAALGPGMEDVYDVYLRVKALAALGTGPNFEPFILMAKRINNILKDAPACRVNPELFLEKEERDLHSTFTIISENVKPMIEKGDFGRAQSIIFRVQPLLNAFFDKVLVMAEDKKVRQNRLGLLQAIRKLLLQVADYSQVVVEGDRTAKPGNSR